MKESLPLPFEGKKVAGLNGFSNVFDSYISENHVVKISKRYYSSLEQAQVELGRYVDDYKEMKKFIGKYLPEASFMITNRSKLADNNIYEIKIVQDKIFGDNISRDIFERDDSAKKQFEEILFASIQYYLSTFDTTLKVGFGKILDISEDNILVSRNDKGDSVLFFVDCSHTLLRFTLENIIDFVESLIYQYNINSEQIEAALDRLREMKEKEEQLITPTSPQPSPNSN